MKSKSNRKKALREKKEKKQESESRKSMDKNQKKALFTIFILVFVIFASFLVPYYYFKKSTRFEYLGLDWYVEVKEFKPIFYITRFNYFDGSASVHNLFLTYDPRKNNVPTYGEFNRFKRNAILSFDPKVNECGSEVFRANFILMQFLVHPMLIKNMTIGHNDEEYAKSLNRTYANCETNPEKSVILIIYSNETYVKQDEKNPYCHIISVNSCDDGRPIEKFILKVLESANIKKSNG